MFQKLATATASFRLRFGPWAGSLLWLELLKEKLLPAGRAFRVHVPGTRAPVWLRARSSDIECFCQIFVHGELDVPVPGQPRYVIDAGANIGLASVWLANRYPGATIDALEVDSANAALLRRNVGAYPNVSVVQQGLWSHACTLKILNPEAESWAFRVGEAASGDPAGFSALSVGDLLSRRQRDRVDLLKIDIEGAEKEVFDASAAWIGRVGTLFVELHDRFKPGCSAAVERACQPRAQGHVVSGEYHVYRFDAAAAA